MKRTAKAGEEAKQVKQARASRLQGQKEAAVQPMEEKQPSAREIAAAKAARARLYSKAQGQVGRGTGKKPSVSFCIQKNEEYFALARACGAGIYFAKSICREVLFMGKDERDHATQWVLKIALRHHIANLHLRAGFHACYSGLIVYYALHGASL